MVELPVSDADSMLFSTQSVAFSTRPNDPVPFTPRNSYSNSETSVKSVQNKNYNIK